MPSIPIPTFPSLLLPPGLCPTGLQGELRNLTQRGPKGGKSAAFGNSGILRLCRGTRALREEENLGFHRSHQAWGCGIDPEQ